MAEADLPLPGQFLFTSCVSVSCCFQGARVSLPQSCWGGTPSPGHVVGVSLESCR